MNLKAYITIIWIALALVASLARADVVTLKDGTTYEGKVVKESSAEVVIEIVISNIKTTKTFPRYKVKSIEYKPLEEQEEPKSSSKKPETTPSKDDAEAEADESASDRRPSSRPVASSRRDRTTFVNIPIEGEIGMQTNATGLENALLQAGRKGVTHIVFTIDSPGGYLYDAIEALKVLKEHDEDFVYHAVVDEGAISAASIYVAAADHIWVRPGSRVGGAVAYSNNASTGATEVDAKLNSIWAADIASRRNKGAPTRSVPCDGRTCCRALGRCRGHGLPVASTHCGCSAVG